MAHDRTPRWIECSLDAQSTALIARAALTCAYWWGGLAKLFDFPGAQREAAHFFGSGPAVPIAVATIVVELVGSGLLIAARFQWLAAGALSVFTALATFVAHDFWNVTDAAEHFREFNAFLEHIGLIGGLMLAAILSRTSSAASR